MRILGRLSAPIWLFLVGYAQSRDFSTRMWVGILVLMLSSYSVGLSILPISILGTIVIGRLMIDPVMNAIRRTPQTLYAIAFILFSMTFVTLPLFEYGSSVLMIVMLGYMVRNRDSLPFSKSDILQFAMVAAAAHLFFQGFVFFSFTTPQFLFVIVTTIALFIALLKFRSVEYPAVTEKTPGFITFLIQVCGRRTLEIYVLHLVIFRFIAIAMGVEGLSWFNFHIF
jgi:hypothetical protein